MNNFLLKLAGLSSQKAMMMGLGLTALWYFMLFDDGSDLQTKINDAQNKIKAEKSKEAESDAALKEIAAVQASVGALSDQFKMVSAQLPTDIQMAEIIRTVDKVSHATGLDVKEKEPKSSVKQEVVEIMPLKVAAEGSFNEITMFFYYLSTIERIVRVKSFTIAAPTDAKKYRAQKLTLNADVVSFKFLPPENKETKPGVEVPKK